MFLIDVLIVEKLLGRELDLFINLSGCVQFSQRAGHWADDALLMHAL